MDVGPTREDAAEPFMSDGLVQIEVIDDTVRFTVQAQTKKEARSLASQIQASWVTNGEFTLESTYGE